MSATLRRLAYFIAFGVVCAYGYIALRGPQGIPALLEKQREIRKLEEENANLQREIDLKRERIKKLKESAAEQELEIRKRLKLLRPGETSFILPEPPKPNQAPAPQPAPPAPK